jgi:hypothetical protein
VAIAIGETATPEFISFWHQRNPMSDNLVGPEGWRFDRQIIIA